MNSPTPNSGRAPDQWVQERSQLFARLEQQELSLRELEISHEKYAKVFHWSPSALALVQVSDWTFLDVNPAFESLTGRCAGELIGRPVSVLALDQDAPELVAELDALVAHGRISERELRLRSKSGAFHHLSLTAEVLELSTGATAFLRALDISARVDAASALRESEARLELALTASHTGVWEWNIHSNAVYWSKNVFSILGPVHFDGKLDDFTRLVHPEDARRVEAAIQKSLADGSTFSAEFRVCLPGGRTRWLFNLGLPRFDANGAPSRMIGTVSDITERKEAVDAVRESEERLALALRATSDGLWDWNVVTGESYHSPRWKELLGYREEEKLEEVAAFQSQIHPLDAVRVREAVLKHFKDRAPFEAEFRLRHQSGEYRWYQSRGRATWDADGCPVRMVGTLRDVTDRRNLEESLRTLSVRVLKLQDEERRRIARELHDSTAQTLAAATMTLSRLAGLLSSDAARELLGDSELLVRAATQEIRTMSYLLHPPILELAGLEGAVREYSDGFSKRSGIRVALSASPGFGRLSESAELALFRIVQESLTNIHLHSGSEVAAISLQRTVDQVSLTVTDHGYGLPADVLQRVSDASGSTGVGIAGMRERLRELGGDLRIVSGASGTTLRVTLELKGPTV